MAKEAELERLIHQEVEKMWQKRLNQWKLEREARKKLLADVLAGRARQLEERCKFRQLIFFMLKLKLTVILTFLNL